MPNINFVPDDYVQNNESRRMNVIYVLLLAVVMAGLGGSFVTIKMRQRAFRAKEALVNYKMARIQKAIKQYEELQTRRKAMMKTALTTAELLEPIPRSVLLASLTNNLPSGTSLLVVKFVQKKSKGVGLPARTNKYQAAQADKETTGQSELSPEKLLETRIDIEGMAPSDLQVAAYIERLSTGTVLDNVALVESKEHKIEDTTFRQFKLTAVLDNDIRLTKADVDEIRAKAEGSVYNF